MGGEVTRVWLLATNLTEVWQAVIVFICPPPQWGIMHTFQIQNVLFKRVIDGVHSCPKGPDF